MKFPHLEKFVDLMKNLKYEHQGTFPCGGGSNSILGTGTENQIFILRPPATIKFFHEILKKMMRKDPFGRHVAMWLFHFKQEFIS